MKYNHFLWAFL